MQSVGILFHTVTHPSRACQSCLQGAFHFKLSPSSTIGVLFNLSIPSFPIYIRSPQYASLTVMKTQKSNSFHSLLINFQHKQFQRSALMLYSNDSVSFPECSVESFCLRHPWSNLAEKLLINVTDWSSLLMTYQIFPQDCKLLHSPK